MNWLKEKLQIEYLDINGILNSLVKLGLIKVASVKGLPSESVFLVNDVFITRSPPTHIIKQTKGKRISDSIVSDYLSNVRAYFERYKPNLDDEKTISDVVADNDTYTVLNLLRLSPVTRKGLDKVKEILESLSIKVDIENEVQFLKQAAITALNSKSVSGVKELFADICVKAANQVKELRANRVFVDVEKIQIKKRQGKSLSDIKLINGIILEDEIVLPLMPKKVENARNGG